MRAASRFALQSRENGGQKPVPYPRRYGSGRTSLSRTTTTVLGNLGQVRASLLPLMTSGGSVILNTSTLSTQGRPYVSVYSATKAAIRSLARSLTVELAEKASA